MRIDNVAPVALGLLAAVMVVAGLIVVGGPEEARRAKRDDARALAVSNLSRCLHNLPKAEFDSLPEVMTAETACASESGWRDPETQEPYRLKREDAAHVLVCATFEKPEKVKRAFYSQTFDPATGCVRSGGPG